MKLQQLLSYTRRAVDDFHMIEAGDKIAVGISGGKDSLTMLYALHGLKRFYPAPFEIEAITVDLGFPGFDLSPIQALCQEMGVTLTPAGDTWPGGEDPNDTNLRIAPTYPSVGELEAALDVLVLATKLVSAQIAQEERAQA